MKTNVEFCFSRPATDIRIRIHMYVCTSKYDFTQQTIQQISHNICMYLIRKVFFPMTLHNNDKVLGHIIKLFLSKRTEIWNLKLFTYIHT